MTFKMSVDLKEGALVEHGGAERLVHEGMGEAEAHDVLAIVVVSLVAAVTSAVTSASTTAATAAAAVLARNQRNRRAERRRGGLCGPFGFAPQVSHVFESGLDVLPCKPWSYPLASTPWKRSEKDYFDRTVTLKPHRHLVKTALVCSSAHAQFK